MINRIPARLRFKLSRVFWITGIWMIIALLEALYIHVLSFDFSGFSSTLLYDFKKNLLLSLLFAFGAGLTTSLILVFYLRSRFRDNSFGFSVFWNTIIVGLIQLILFGFSFWIYTSISQQLPLFSKTVFSDVLDFYQRYFFLKKLSFWLIITFLTILLLDVNEKYGTGVLKQLVLGKYHNPKEEERIFMFLDMKGSTGIAERIGHIQFFELLTDFFKDITDPILYTNGNIYQYIGDEVVIVWKMQRGIRNANCIRCFYNIREAISRKRSFYLEKYGLVPEFKAGIHCGKVTIGEMGVLKRDIVFSGDVLNTTSRMQSMCNEFGVKLLISKRLLDRVAFPPDSLEARKIGDISLKGKRKKVVLYTIEEA